MKITDRSLARSFLGLCLAALPLFAQAKEEPKQPPVVSLSKPNIVVVMADDMGWGDSGTYGHPVIQSPNLDALAAQGVKFTQGYSAAGVCSPSRSAILTGRTPYRNGVWRHLSGVHQAHLRASEITYPELLREAGYQTCHVGKWHLLSRQQFDNPDYPQVGEQGGFDYWFATHNNADPSHKNPNNFIRNGEHVGELEGYSAPLVADEAIHWINELRDPEKPFVMSVWFHEPHKPIATDIKFSSLYPNESERDATYYGNITQLDYALGEVMKALDANGLTDNTLLIFTSDNGPVPSSGGDSGGLRGNKRNDFEGGIRVPFLVRWPGHIEPGTVSDTPVIGTDIFSTVLDIVDVPAPQDRTIDGASMLPVFAGKEAKREIPMFWRTHVSSPEDRVAMRLGDWKIVGNDTLTKFMLFNVQEDSQEKKDLASSMPEKLDEMKRLLVKTWNDINAEGPNEWWEGERNKPGKGAKLNY
ncbi:sulfatase-like hydrolase/transferase [Coraliomargarita sp. SDUM461003]|uniref:Sulfatase-like hydrolase/transferase n=1 Tax=Thalassobacterium maritimum TaxID=3041265 RepID=A0ABU1AT92_9BACT|nr:sulfatase-like hydrolase/transferase [Coraliomargarita sp. SDUM461003]MDQ8207385.1 sulfatase-like hydrolase/transferase [Coraliomargarita sp. SDUM461003]